MIPNADASPKARVACYIAIIFLAPALLTQCTSTGGTYKDVEYDSATLKTPTGHGLTKSDYPFDDSGDYRKDWVKSKTSGRTQSSYDRPNPKPTSNTQSMATVTGTPVANSSDSSSGSSALRASSVATDSSPTYHKVNSGDTLFSLSSKYGASVAEIKRVNGMTSDTIRTGQSLRIP
tara:strand:+ start:2788 stop:3318 length:531 start_codon:yes stop_codon:yes gene_type:complete